MTWRMGVIVEALSWQGTAFRMNASIKRVGIDCGRFPHAVYGACGISVPELPRHWPKDFMCHAMADSEPYLAIIASGMNEVAMPEPGDLAVFKPIRSRCYSHAAIVLDWPHVIHARGIGHRPQVEIGSALEWPFDQIEPVKFFTPHV